MFFKNLCVFVLWTEVTSTLEGLNISLWTLFLTVSRLYPKLHLIERHSRIFSYSPLQDGAGKRNSLSAAGRVPFALSHLSKALEHLLKCVVICFII